MVRYAWAKQWFQGPNSPHTDLFVHPRLYTCTLAQTRQVSCIEHEISTIGIFLYVQGCMPHICNIAAYFLQPFLYCWVQCCSTWSVVLCLWTGSRSSITLRCRWEQTSMGTVQRGSCWKAPAVSATRHPSRQACQWPAHQFTRTRHRCCLFSRKRCIWFFPCK